MSTGLAIRSTVTLLTAGCVIYAALFPTSHFPFRWNAVDSHTIAVEPRGETALPPGLRAGDRIDLREQNLSTRAALWTATSAEAEHELKLRRDGEPVSITVGTIPGQGSNLGLLYLVTMPLLLVLGLSTVWWGRDWAAWGLSFFALGVNLNIFLFTLSLPPAAAFAVVLFNQIVVLSLITGGLYLSALAMSGPGIAGRLRSVFHALFALAVLASAALLSTQVVAFIAYGYALSLTGAGAFAFVMSLLIPVAVLIAALPRADAARRLRLRWVIWSLALFVGAIVWNNLDEISDAFSTRGVLRQTIWWSAALAGLAGLLYSVLGKRVVAMSFAVNRALVYGLVAALVIGVFALLAAVLENTAIGRDAGLALTVCVSLGIGLVLEALRDRINSVVERLFFRRMYEAETALRRFAHQCAYIARPDHLLAEAEAEIHRHTQPRSSAFYEPSASGYARVRQRGEPAYPERIDVDDRAFVAMRAEREAVDLGSVHTALGSEGWAFPMAVRGELRGALVCGARTEEYTRDERKLVAEVAHQVGIALHALRARDNEAFVSRIASGALDPAEARHRARALHAAWAIDPRGNA